MKQEGAQQRTELVQLLQECAEISWSPTGQEE